MQTQNQNTSPGINTLGIQVPDTDRLPAFSVVASVFFFLGWLLTEILPAGSWLLNSLLAIAIVVALGEGLPLLIIYLNPISPWATSAIPDSQKKLKVNGGASGLD